MTMTPDTTPVTLDGDTVFHAAHVSQRRWNGWLCPYFTEAEGKRIAAWLAVQRAEYPDTEGLEWDAARRVFVMTEPAGTIDDDPHSYDVDTYTTPDGTVLHGIGAFGWVWSRP